MKVSALKIVRKFRERSVSITADHSTYGLAASLGDMLRPFSLKAIAQRVGASTATVKHWKDGVNGPTWKHAVAMLNDDELCAKLLEAAGRGDLAHAAETITALRTALGMVNEAK